MRVWLICYAARWSLFFYTLIDTKIKEKECFFGTLKNSANIAISVKRITATIFINFFIFIFCRILLYLFLFSVCLLIPFSPVKTRLFFYLLLFSLFLHTAFQIFSIYYFFLNEKIRDFEKWHTLYCFTFSFRIRIWISGICKSEAYKFQNHWDHLLRNTTNVDKITLT